MSTTNDASLKVPLLNVTKTNLSENATGGGGTDQGRKKVVLEKGYSLMDWIRYSKSTPNIAGNYGVLRKITYEELALHDKPDDCWMAIFGKYSHFFIVKDNSYVFMNQNTRQGL